MSHGEETKKIVPTLRKFEYKFQFHCNEKQIQVLVAHISPLNRGERGKKVAICVAFLLSLRCITCHVSGLQKKCGSNTHADTA